MQQNKNYVNEIFGLFIALALVITAIYYSSRNHISTEEYFASKRNNYTTSSTSPLGENNSYKEAIKRNFEGLQALSDKEIADTETIDLGCMTVTAPKKSIVIINICEVTVFYNEKAQSFFALDPIYENFDTPDQYLYKLDVAETEITPGKVTSVAGHSANDIFFKSSSRSEQQPQGLPQYTRREVAVKLSNQIIDEKGKTIYGFRIYGNYDSASEKLVFNNILESINLGE